MKTKAAYPLAERAHNALIILMDACTRAQERGLQNPRFTYGELGRHIGLSAGIDMRTIGRVLDHIAIWCITTKRPILTALVVNKATGDTGRLFDYLPAEKVEAELAAIIAYDWRTATAPSPEALGDIRRSWKQS
jgi:hypothetical protein